MKNWAILICLIGLSLMISLVAWGSVGAKTLDIKSSDYPSLSEKEVGHLRWIIKLANQAPGDWSNMGGKEPGQEHLEAYRYQMAFMTYALALAQYHKTPAYREIYQQAMDRFIQKMLRQDVWSFWAEVSKGAEKFNPDLKERGQGWLDPVKEKNIMYSGHLIHMVGLYKMLYRDTKYDQPSSITFNWETGYKVIHKYEYNFKSLAEVIHRQLIQGPSNAKVPLNAIECEVNVVFPECNQHPVLGLMLYDYTNGSNLSTVKDLVRKTFYEKKFIDPDTHHFMFFYMNQQDKLTPAVSPGADGWSGAFMHAWDPNLIETHYPYQAKIHVKWNPDGTANTPDKVWGPIGEPFFAILAKEMGDGKTAEGILAWADKNYDPIWQDGMFYYPRNDEKRVTSLVDKLFAVAMLNVKNGLWAMHNRPWGDDEFNKPYVSRVEYPKAIVKQAYYDPSKDVLIVTIMAGTKDTRTTSFTVNKLDRSKNYSITKDGKTLGQLKNGILQPKSGIKEIEWKSDGTLSISTNLIKPNTFLIQAER